MGRIECIKQKKLVFCIIFFGSIFITHHKKGEDRNGGYRAREEVLSIEVVYDSKRCG